MKMEMVNIHPINPARRVFNAKTAKRAASSFPSCGDSMLLFVTNNRKHTVFVFRDFIDEIPRSVNEIIIAGS